MRKTIFFFAILSVTLLSSCNKGYTHEKAVINNSRETVTVVSGCCNNQEVFNIEPGETKTVFACYYQQLRKPSTEELSWEFELIQKGAHTDLSNPALWINKEQERALRYEYTVQE